MRVFFFFLALLIVNTSFGQNVGIGTTSPKAKLDINGDLILRNVTITLVDGPNENINTDSARYSHFTIVGPATVFEMGGITGGIDGRMVTFYNTSAYIMVIKHLSAGSIPKNQIHTGTGIDLSLSSYSSISFRYLSFDSLWHIVATHNEWNPSTSGLWNANGNDIYNTNPGRVGIATNQPLEMLHMDSGSIKVGRNVWTTGVSNTFLKFGDNNFVTIGEDEADDHLVIKAKNFVFKPSGAGYPGNVGIGTSPSSLYKLQVNGNIFASGIGINYGSGFSGGGLQISASDHPNQTVLLDGKSIQAFGGTTALAVPTPKDFTLNPFGGKIQVGSISSAATTSISFPNRLGNKISFWSNGPNNEFGIGLNSGNLQLYTAGFDRISFGNGNANSFNEAVGIISGGPTQGIYAPETGNLNIVPLGIIQFSFRTNGTGVQEVVITNVAGNMATGGYGNITTISDDDFISFLINLDVVKCSNYSTVIAIGSPEYNGVNRFIIRAQSNILRTATEAALEIRYGADGFQPTGNTSGSFQGFGKYILYGIK